MRKSKYVTSYFVTKYPNGVYALTFNTTERWLRFHAYNDEMYGFGEEMDDVGEGWESCLQEIPKFLPREGKTTWMRSAMQNKDQITFFFIPYKHDWINQEEVVIAETYNKLEE